jgi:UDP-3-O-[3-hydroxymyristoyl] glucosamine N-acyltransferase
VIHANAVLGAHGFGYRVLDGRNQPAAQLGWVEVGSHCEIGACSTVDRGTYGPTIIGDGTKLDNLVLIAHNCRIGKHNMICSQVGVAGSTTTGDYVVMAGQVGVRDHVRIGDRSILAAKAGVSCDVPDGAHFLGCPAIPEREQKIQFAAISKLPDMRRQLKRLQQTIDAMTREQTPNPNSNGHAA